MRLLAQALEGNRSLKVLNLVASITTPHAETVIAQVLPLTGLEKLHLSYNHISNVISLGTALRGTTCLKELYLDFNNISNALPLVEFLKVNQMAGLEIIQLNCNNIGDCGAIAFGELLKTNTSLCRLYLGRNNITNVGAMALLQGLESNVSLMELHLDGNVDISQELVDRIDYLVKANQFGRYLLRQEGHLPAAFWPHLLGRVRKEPNLVYFFVTSKPDLCKMCYK